MKEVLRIVFDGSDEIAFTADYDDLQDKAYPLEIKATDGYVALSHEEGRALFNMLYSIYSEEANE